MKSAQESASSSGTRRTVCSRWTTTASCPTTGMMPTVSARSRLPAKATRCMSTESSLAAPPIPRSSRSMSARISWPTKAAVTPNISTQAASASCQRSAISPPTALTRAALSMQVPTLTVFLSTIRLSMRHSSR